MAGAQEPPGGRLTDHISLGVLSAAFLSWPTIRCSRRAHGTDLHVLGLSQADLRTNPEPWSGRVGVDTRT